MIIFTNSISQALVLLAQRSDPKNIDWWSVYDKQEHYIPLVNGSIIYRCCICECRMRGVQNITEHGLNHLKEKGLTVFI